MDCFLFVLDQNLFYFVFLGHLNALMVAYGPPTFFLTLSVAEYDWADVARVLRERCKLSGQKESEWIHCSNMELIESDPCGFSEHFLQRFKKLWALIKGILKY